MRGSSKRSDAAASTAVTGQNQIAVEVHVRAVEVRERDAAGAARQQHAERAPVDARKRRDAGQGEDRHQPSVLRRYELEPQPQGAERTPRIECAHDRFARMLIAAENLVEKSGFRARRIHVPIDMAAAADLQRSRRIELMRCDIRRAQREIGVEQQRQRDAREAQRDRTCVEARALP
jgi:hypothetical protein